MAVSNRDRVQKGFELLAEGLEPFVDEKMSADAPTGDWIDMLEARDEQKNGVRKTYDKHDPAVLLRCITDDWRVFRRSLSRAQQSFASELRDTRNKWAHNEKFSADDTYRALDTMERLLQAVGAVGQAEAVHQIRVDLGRSSVEAETRKAVAHADSSATVAGTGVKGWREVLRPHDDVATGNFSASEFAADLARVAKGEGAAEYVEPVEFFRRTFLTEGLRDLLERGVRRVSGDMNASPVINLQTNFGGGKTHSMLALWHLLGGTPVAAMPQEVQDLVDGRELPAVRRVALVGTQLQPGQPLIKPDGTVVNTMWGELAWQLGGREAFDMVAESDAARTSPGQSLADLLEAYSPCLILVDEWVAYARQLVDRDDLAGGSFATQFTFAQTLTETVKTTPGAMLVISIPASYDPERDGESGGSALEVGGPNGQQALQQLQNVVRRVADQWRPASSQESFEIVRRRLFVEPDAAALADIAAVARQFVQFYAKHAGEFPRECSQPDYEHRIKAAYPIHPELFDRLYEDWSTLDRFQRTRGVLQLMSAVIHHLWAAQDAGPLIMPGSVPLDSASVLSQISQYLPDSWKAIIDVDIDGPGSTAVEVDGSRPQFSQRALTRRIARTIFVAGAPTLRSAHKGVERPHIWLGVAIPGDVVGNFGSSLEVLGQRATYLYNDGQRYWFDTQPSVGRIAAEMADRLRERPDEVWAEIVRRLRQVDPRSRGAFAGVHVAPDSGADVPDEDAARLVIVSPAHPHRKDDASSAALQFAVEALDKRGSAQRINRNMLVFLAADAKRLDELMDSTRSYLAWQDIVGRIDDLNLSPQQVSQARDRQEDASQATDLRIGQTYIHALVPEQPDPGQPITWSVEKADGQETSLALRTSQRLSRAGLLTDVSAPRTLRLDLDTKLARAWESGHISVGDLWALYAQYSYLARMKNRDVLVTAVRDVVAQFTWEAEGFALADGFDASTGRYVGLVIPDAGAVAGAITDATLLVKPSVATAQAPETSSGSDLPRIVNDPSGNPGDGAGPGLLPPEPPAHSHYHGVARVNPERYGRDFTRISQEILQHLAAMEGVDLDITVEIQARSTDGFPEDKVRIILENASALKFEQSTFESD